MKKRILILLLIGIIFSCSNDDDNTNTDELSGVWNLVNVACLCPPVDFQVGEHVWNFNLSNNVINVINNPDETLQILDSGDYDFSLNSNKIIILSVEYDYYFENGKLFLSDHPQIDGLLMEFVRN